MAVLYTFLLLLSFFLSSIALGGPAGILTIILLGLFPLLLYLFKSNIPGLVYISLLVLIALLLPAVSTPREACRRMCCTNNLKQLGLALHNYQQHYKCFPPAIVYDDNGKPMHSWRVLILPFIEGYESISIYKQYDFNEPWDGPNNIKLLEQRPYGFVCPSDEIASSDYKTTSYIAFVGPDTVWTDKDFNSGNYRSVMLVETSGSDVKWTEPRDYVMPAENAPQPQNQPTISSKHSIGPGPFYHPIPCAQVAYSDGSVEILPSEPISNNIYPRGDRESIRKFTNRWVTDHRRRDWQTTITFSVWLVSYILLIHWSVRCKNTAIKQTAEVAETAETNVDADGTGEE